MSRCCLPDCSARYLESFYARARIADELFARIHGWIRGRGNMRTRIRRDHRFGMGSATHFYFSGAVPRKLIAILVDRGTSWAVRSSGRESGPLVSTATTCVRRAVIAWGTARTTRKKVWGSLRRRLLPADCSQPIRFRLGDFIVPPRDGRRHDGRRLAHGEERWGSASRSSLRLVVSAETAGG